MKSDKYFVESFYSNWSSCTFVVMHNSVEEQYRYCRNYDTYGANYVVSKAETLDEFVPITDIDGIELVGDEYDTYDVLVEHEEHPLCKMLLLMGWLCCNYGMFTRDNMWASFLGRDINEFDFEFFREHRYNVINMGKFEGEDISWRLLHREEDALLLVSDKVLDIKAFDERKNNYAESDIRKWLNDDFYNAAFSEDEKSKILYTEVPNSKETACIGNELSAGRKNLINADVIDTKDYCFLLSTLAVDAGFLEWRNDGHSEILGIPSISVENSDEYVTESRVALDTKYVTNKLIDSGIIDEYDYDEVFDDDPSAPWWLRSAGMHEGSVRVVDSTGEIKEINPDRDDVGIRVACRIAMPHITIEYDESCY